MSSGASLDQPQPKKTSIEFVEEMFSQMPQESVELPKRHKLQSTGSSSSTSLEVSEILEGAKKPGSDMPYEEEEESTPQPEGVISVDAEIPEDNKSDEARDADNEEEEEEDVQEEEEIQEEIEADEEEEDDDDKEVVEEEFEEVAQEDEEEAGGQGSEGLGVKDMDEGQVTLNTRTAGLVNVSPPVRAEYDSRIWPKAPTVPSVDQDLGLEARMLAAEAIHRAATHQTR